MLDPIALFTALADETRLRTVILLTQEPPLCVCEVTEALGVSQPKISRHLAILRDNGLVEDQRVANRVFYRIHRSLPTWAWKVLDTTAAARAAYPPFADDRARLRTMSNRPDRSDLSWPSLADAGRKDHHAH
ncbi:MAG: ArsR family transcriptional regulator [Rhodospirillales bacterium]|nr:MAG: ArsR family transcriptional regulator [Rhodospirillales bacterium]